MLANELHDSLAQTMAYMKMRLPMLRDAVENRDEARSNKYVNDLGQALDSAYAELRELQALRERRHDAVAVDEVLLGHSHLLLAARDRAGRRQELGHLLHEGKHSGYLSNARIAP